MTEGELKEYIVDVDSATVDVQPRPDQSLAEAVASAGAELVRVEPPRFTVRVKAASESEAQIRAVEALERWASGPGADWKAGSVSTFVD